MTKEEEIAGRAIRDDFSRACRKNPQIVAMFLRLHDLFDRVSNEETKKYLAMLELEQRVSAYAHAGALFNATRVSVNKGSETMMLMHEKANSMPGNISLVEAEDILLNFFAEEIGKHYTPSVILAHHELMGKMEEFLN